MLDPEYLDRAGDMVAAVYGEIEAEMLDLLCRMLLDQDLEGLGQRGATALNLLAQSAAPRLMACVERHREDANRAVLRTVEDALWRSDRADLAGMPKAARDAAGRTLPRQVELTARGIAEILERDNVDMAQGALSLWNRCVAEAATRVNAGAETAERAIHRAVRRMMREGVSTIAYRDAGTGRQTVVNRVDVAVRRHVRTQIAQDGMRRTLEVCEGAGIRLVEVSSHGGSRPEHARWQGRVYSLGGEVEIDGVTYKDFYSETGYGKVDGLGGANCVPGGTLVSGPDAQVAYRRQYEGDVVIIHTASGDELTATPNHPVLTDKGWVPAQFVEEGDHVFRARLSDGMSLSVGPNDHHAPASIAEVFDSLRDSGEVRSFLGSPADFHGDGSLNGQVDVVLPHGLLADYREPARREHPAEKLLHSATRPAGALPANGATLEIGVGADHASDRVVGMGGQGGALVGAHPGEPGSHGGGPILGGVAVLGEPFADDPVPCAHADGDVVLGDAGFVQPDYLSIVERKSATVGNEPEAGDAVPDDLPADPQPFPNGVEGEAFLVEPCEVVDVHRDTFSGHVYNLSTESGWYFANGIVTHNCRHSFGPWIPGTSRTYSPDPAHPSGLPSDEVYAMGQGQRARERGIRRTKRELAGAQLIADKDASMANIAEVERLKRKLSDQQKAMRDYISECNSKGKAPVLQRSPNREWAGDMPRIRKTDASRRTMRDFMDSDGVKRALKARGVSKTAAQKALSSEMKHRGIASRDFSMLSRANQQSVFKAALTRKKPSDMEARRSSMKPVNAALYSSQKNYVERHGGVVLRGGDEAERHLDSMGVDAAYMTGAGVIMLRHDATTSEVLEEVYHFQQDQRGDYSDRNAAIMTLLRERDAQRYLLSVAERYNIPKSETAQTEKALEGYLRKLKEAGIDEG